MKKNAVTTSRGTSTMKMRHGILLGLALVGVSSARADMYKCVVDGQVNYSDQPCGTKSTVVRSAPATQGSAGPDLNRQLDARVAAAIADGDLIRAESLATTPDQRRAVAIAKRDAAMDASARRAETDRAAQVKATEALAKAAAKPKRCVTESYSTGTVIGNTVSGDTTGVTTCR